jgi:hypothetical protein
MLSLKKAATLQTPGWSLGEPTAHAAVRFTERRGGIAVKDEIHLDTFVNTYEGAQRQA